ncbi:MAG: sugar phosphate isomerase/epimerase [Oscillospiraceae bacterium]|nr:sugar phosphate isomerase/epimerase [Oscillospiraceae bacterium]
MKLSFSTLGCPDYDIDGIIGIAVKCGYPGIELRAAQGTVDLCSLSSFRGAGLAETAEKLNAGGLEVSCIGSSVNFAKSCEAEKQKMLDAAKAYIELCSTLKCRYLRVFGGPLVVTQGYLESIEAIQDGMEELCGIAEKYGVMPLLETHDDFCTAARVLDIISGVSSENIGVLWDILHPYRYGEAVGETFAKLGGKIRHVHVKDGKALSPANAALVLTGEGDMPIGECVSLLKENGYRGYLSLEWEKMWHTEIEGPEIALPQYVKYMGRYD